MDVGRLAQLLGARVHAAEFNSPDVVSSATRSPHGETKIFVDASLTPERKRVAVATELARVLLERADVGQPDPSKDFVAKPAHELLMPRGLMSSMWPLIRDKHELAPYILCSGRHHGCSNR